MIVFEHRKADNAKSLRFGWGMTDIVVATFVGESQRQIAYSSCPTGHVVWERNQ